MDIGIATFVLCTYKRERIKLMKNLFTANKKFMLRQPTTTDIVIDFSEEKIRELCLDIKFREKIRVASKSLLNMMDEFLENPNKWKEKTKKSFFASIMKYYIRSVKRPTPFGLFSGVGIGEFAEKEIFNDTNEHFQKKVNIDTSWLYGYIENIEKKLYRNLEFRINGIIKREGNRVTLIYSSKDDIEEISIRYTNVFAILEKVCKSYTSFSKIVSEIQKEYEDINKSIIVDYLKELVDKNVLISSLRPPFTIENSLQYVIEQCERLNISEKQKLINLNKLCLQYENTDIGTGGEIYDSIISEMEKIYKSKYYLQVDTIILGEEVNLSSKTKKDIEQLATYLTKISEMNPFQNSTFEQYRELFLDKYGFQRQIPILEMLDPITGIGAPNGYSVPRNKFYEEQPQKKSMSLELENFFIRKYEKATADKKAIKFTKEELEHFISLDNNENIPTSFEMYFSLEEKEGQKQLVLSNILGSNCAGKTFGRFSIADSKIKNVLDELNYREKALRLDDIESCEISHLPKERRSGNITRCTSKRECVLSAYTNVEDKKKEINLNDILIGTTEDRFYAINKQSGKEIIFGSNNMYNLTLQPNAFRFLLEIENDGKLNWCEFPWDRCFDNYRHIPQIEFEDIILAKEKWFFSLNDLEAGKKCIFEDFKKIFNKFRREHHIPAKVNLSEFDNTISLNLEKEIALWIVYEEVKKKKGESILFERIDEKSNAIEYESGRKISTEIVVPVFRKTKEVKREKPKKSEYIERIKHLVFPYENWLYFRVYCTKEREVELIALNLRLYGFELKEKYGIEHFFMRFMDPKPHIRIRFYGIPEKLMCATPEILLWLNKLVRENVVGDYNISVYEREIERYGGEQLIKYAESLFRIDSFVVEEILYYQRNRQLELEKEEIVILSIFKIIMQFYSDYEQQLEFLTRHYHSNYYKDEFRQKKDNYLKLFDIENNFKNYRKNQERDWLIKLLEKRNSAIQLYNKKIEENKLNIFKSDIIASILHLHCNRLLGTDRELENKIMSFAEGIMYSKKYMLREIKKNEY